VPRVRRGRDGRDKFFHDQDVPSIDVLRGSAGGESEGNSGKCNSSGIRGCPVQKGTGSWTGGNPRVRYKKDVWGGGGGGVALNSAKEQGGRGGEGQTRVQGHLEIRLSSNSKRGEGPALEGRHLQDRSER